MAHPTGPSDAVADLLTHLSTADLDAIIADPAAARDALLGTAPAAAAGAVPVAVPAPVGGIPIRTLAVGTTLTHGTTVQQFTTATGAQQALPNPPAWFAIGSRFSAHAGGRYGTASTYLHNYVVQAVITLLRFADFPTLRAYLAGFGTTHNENNVAAANDVLLHNPTAHGYTLDADLVRGEPEVILFAAGMANLAAQFQSQLDRSERPSFGDDMDVDRRNVRLGHGNRVVHESSDLDLTDFRTIGDDDRGRRPRGQEEP
ncbi:hypothetical protein ALI144C_24155 [Actinosynnema sp. ALI-1.44]|uniref:hypothetical protein n=1 Tax=Actinosynnema sp. ALI-1.44 TaxID=1933779 RepID=UPI00097C6DD2|nr:hypothetical protein [Actinosynnema sp. ALI-1.44]ONI79830.1 hypothetical protein ALI144C_24155 [Actinosynnema sp. ALI-1.44]